MSITNLRTAISQRARTASASADQLASVRSGRAAAFTGEIGALAGSGLGKAMGLGASVLIPGVGLAVFVAMGVLFGAFNGGLIGLLMRFDGR